MKTKPGSCLPSLVVLATVLAAPVSAATSPLADRATVSALMIDGAAAGGVLGWDGGDARSGASATATMGTATGKLPTGVTYAPLSMRVAFPPAPAVAAWVNEMAAGRAGPRTVVVADADATGRLVEAYELSGAALIEVEFPEFNGARTTLAVMRLVFAGASGGAVSPPASLSGVSTPANTAGFQLSFPGIDTTGVSRIAAIRVVQSGATAPVSADSVTGKSVGATKTANFAITVSRASVASWQAWLSDTLMQAPGSKREGAIALLGPTLKVSSVTLNLYGCSLVRLSRPPDWAGVPTYYVAEVACERVAFGGLPASAGAASESTIAAKREVTSPKELPTDRSAAVEADRGTRDPVLFPRVPGLTRTGYSGSYQKASTNETARYASQEKINDLVARVEAAATAAGWKLTHLTESGTGSGRQVTQNWAIKDASAQLTFFDVQDGVATHMNLTVAAQRGRTGGDLK
jgi:hypothetical protein